MGALDAGEDGIERIAGPEILDGGAGAVLSSGRGIRRFHQGADGQGEEFVGSVSDDQVLDGAAMESCSRARRASAVGLG